MAERVPLPGSRIPADVRIRRVRAADPDTPLEITLLLRRPPAQEQYMQALLSGTAAALPREASRLAADPEDIRRVTGFAAAYGLRVVSVNEAARTVKIAGTVAQLDAAFGTDLAYLQGPQGEHLGYEGELSVPAEVGGSIEAVLGLDRRPVARS